MLPFVPPEIKNYISFDPWFMLGLLWAVMTESHQEMELKADAFEHTDNV